MYRHTYTHMNVTERSKDGDAYKCAIITVCPKYSEKILLLFK